MRCETKKETSKKVEDKMNTEERINEIWTAWEDAEGGCSTEVFDFVGSLLKDSLKKFAWDASFDWFKTFWVNSDEASRLEDDTDYNMAWAMIMSFQKNLKKANLI